MTDYASRISTAHNCTAGKWSDSNQARPDTPFRLCLLDDTGATLSALAVLIFLIRVAKFGVTAKQKAESEKKLSLTPKDAKGMRKHEFNCALLMLNEVF
jgi:hypothetical protein